MRVQTGKRTLCTACAIGKTSFYEHAAELSSPRATVCDGCKFTTMQQFGAGAHAMRSCLAIYLIQAASNAVPVGSCRRQLART